jgi:hypothetical protein
MGNSNEKKSDSPDSYAKPDLDLIGMVQRARMQNDATVLPSQAASMYWIEAKRSVEIVAPAVTARVAQWIITTTADRADALWAQIKVATEAGLLGYKSKICTASRTPEKPNERVIMVCTYDKNDGEDVERVRVVLQEMIGLGDELNYANT